MPRLTIMMLAAAALAGCQSTAVEPTRSKDPRFDLFCHDRPFESGICEQPTNFRLFAPMGGNR